MGLVLRLAVFLLLASLAVPAAAAGAGTTVEKTPFDLTFEACGESISLSGTLLTIIHEQPLANGGSLFTIHFQPQGLSGTSSSGVPYHGTGLTRETDVVAPSGGFTATFVNRFHIVGTRDSPTYYVKGTAHVTVTPAGTVTVDFGNFSEECV